MLPLNRLTGHRFPRSFHVGRRRWLREEIRACLPALGVIADEEAPGIKGFRQALHHAVSALNVVLFIQGGNPGARFLQDAGWCVGSRANR